MRQSNSIVHTSTSVLLQNKHAIVYFQKSYFRYADGFRVANADPLSDLELSIPCFVFAPYTQKDVWECDLCHIFLVARVKTYLTYALTPSSSSTTCLFCCECPYL